ncbi:MAG: Sapep family Mn(2+)-dependent dipeptidase [Bacilli bacterium]|nr:Sapep family Mn(2+)-dependent dipeptidase [Bacilli bacterium]
MPNWNKLAKSYEKNALLALQQFIRIPSVYDAKTVSKDAPFGADVKKALEYFAKLGKDYGWESKIIDGYCTEITVGTEGPLIGIYGHSDVVPVSGKWTHKPFGAEIKDGVVYGRGACDDKGPLLAAFFATKLLADNGLIKGFRVKLVSGGDEERGSSCLEHYFNVYKGETPKFGFTPDANWPLIYAEKGIHRYDMTKELSLDPIINMDGGVVANAVCDSVLVTLKPDEKFAKYLKDNAVKCEITSTPVLLMVRFVGKTAHGSTPELGENAIKNAFYHLGKFYKLEALSKIAEAMADNNGHAFGGYNHSKELGDTTYNYGVVKYDGKILKMTLDFRFGEEAMPQELANKLFAFIGMEAELKGESKLLIFDKKSPLVSTLMKAYKWGAMDLFAKPLAIGGGTYAKEAPNTVAFGAEFKNHPGNMHSPDEYIYVSDFIKDIAIYARAIYALGTKK